MPPIPPIFREPDTAIDSTWRCSNFFILVVVSLLLAFLNPWFWGEVLGPQNEIGRVFFLGW